jgi:transposase
MDPVGTCHEARQATGSGQCVGPALAGVGDHAEAAVADQLGIWPQTVAKWRGRFVRERLDGLTDAPRPGRPRTITDTQIEQVITETLEEPPPHHGTHWSTRSMARPPG